MQLRNQIEETFGSLLFKRPLFYSYPNGLRVELSEGRTSIEQFIVALQKATTVLDDVFAESDEVVLCLATHVWQSIFSCREMLSELRGAEIPIPEDRTFWSKSVEPDDWADELEPEYFVALAFTLPRPLIKNALWCALARDLGIRPRLTCSVYLLNLRTGVAVFPYDDRGMDIVGPNTSVLRDLFFQHQELLLPHDLHIMQTTYGAL